jgi:hypothetical protein
MKDIMINFMKPISKTVTIPGAALGGTKNYNDYQLEVNEGFASAVALPEVFLFIKVQEKLCG